LIEQGRKTLGDRVRFLVRYPRDRMPELYRLADVFALCSLREMMPIALIEATASGLPCLVHRHPVCQWIVGPGGESIDMSVSGSLAAALKTLLDDANRRRTCGGQARNIVAKAFRRTRWSTRSSITTNSCSGTLKCLARPRPSLPAPARSSGRRFNRVFLLGSAKRRA